MKLILLGTGTSTGIPEVGCGCMLCHSSDIRDKRLRTSALLISEQGTRILIDCGPDFRQQANQIGLDHLDAIVLTHEHYDHVYGLDDLRTIAWFDEIPIYGQSNVLEAVRRRMHYVFTPNPYPGTPKLSLNELREDEKLLIDDIEITPLVVMHGKLPIFGYRFHQIGTSPSEDISYITDMKTADSHEIEKVYGSRLLVINALRYQREHPSHQNVVDVLQLLETFPEKPQQVILTHLSHHAPSHQELINLLPQDGSIIPGYDFACISMEDSIKITPCHLPSCLLTDVLSMGDNSRDHSVENLGVSTPPLGFLKANDEQRSILYLGIEFLLDPFLGTAEDLNECILQAMHRMVGLFRMQAEEIDQCIISLAYKQLDDRIHAELALAVNRIDEASQQKTMQDFCDNTPQDITVVKHFLTGCIHTQVQPLIKDKYKGSLIPTNY